MISARAQSLGLMKEINKLISSGVIKPEYISPIIRRFQRTGDMDELYLMLLDLPVEENIPGTRDPYEIFGEVLKKIKNHKTNNGGTKI